MSNNENISNHGHIVTYFDFTYISMNILTQNIDDVKINKNYENIKKKKNSKILLLTLILRIYR